jgi:hypothetical protein
MDGEELNKNTAPEGMAAESQNDIPIAEHVPPSDPQGDALLPETGTVDGGEITDKDRPKRPGRPPKVKTGVATVESGGNPNPETPDDESDSVNTNDADDNVKKTEKPSEEKNNSTPSGNGNVRIKHAGMAGKKIFLRRGEIGTFDNEGILEVEVADAERLLSIPGYERA